MMKASSTNNVADFVVGFRAAFNGCLVAYENDDIAKLQRKTFRMLFYSMVSVHVLFILMFLPLQLFLAILGRVVPEGNSVISLETVVSLQERFSMSSLIFYSMWYIPLVALFVIRYVVGGFESHFFTILGTQDSVLCSNLSQCVPSKVHELLFRQLKRGARILSFALAMYLFWGFPLLASLILPPYMIYSLRNASRRSRILLTLVFFLTLYVLQGYQLIPGHFVVVSFWVFRNLRRYMRTAGIVGDLFVLTFCCVCSLDFLEPFVLLLLNVTVVANAISLELLDPYICRARLSEKELNELRADNSWLLLGYGLPLAILLTLPLVGLLGWGYAQASTAVLLTKMRNVRINARS